MNSLSCIDYARTIAEMRIYSKNTYVEKYTSKFSSLSVDFTSHTNLYIMFKKAK